MRWKSHDFRSLLPDLCSLTAALLLLLACGSSAAIAQFRDGHESPQPTWRLAQADCGVRVLAQERTYRTSHGGNGSEALRLSLGRGTYVHLTQPIGKAPLIAEFVPSLWVKADKPNLQLMVRVVLPRSLDPGTGQPLTTLLLGDVYSEVGTWQQVFVREPLKLFDREIIALRTRFGPQVDPREAYVDLVVLNAYSSEGNIDIWLDDLEIRGYLNQEAALTTAGEPQAVRRAIPVAGAPDVHRHTFTGPQSVALQGSLLLVRGRPLMPRIIQHNGEPLEWLQTLGFNAVRLAASPTPVELQEAARLDLWLVAPPPYNEDAALGANFDHVLAWSLGSQLADRDLEATRELARDVRNFDPNPQRPLVCSATSHLEEYSRTAGILQFDQSALGTSLELSGYRYWLQSRTRLARPGTPLWAGIATQTPARLYEQQILFGSAAKHPDDTDLDQMRLVAFQALAAGSRGLMFHSHWPLAIDTIPGAIRTDALKLLNYELQALEPWAAAGSVVDEPNTGDPTVQASVLQTERSKLLLVTRHAIAQQYVAAPPPRGAVSVIVPGVPISDRAYQVTYTGLKQLKAVPGNGGLRVTIDDTGLATAVVITQDPLVVHHINRTLAGEQRNIARLRFDIAARRLVQVQDIDRELSRGGHPLEPAAEWLREAQATLDQARRLFEARDYSNLHATLSRADQALARVRRGHWEHVAGQFPSPASSPCIAQFNTLPLHWAFATRMQRSAWGPNSLPAGAMEHLDELLRSGWKQDRGIPAGIGADVALSLQNPHSGRSALRLQAWVADAQQAPPALERPCVWITSAPVPVRQGQLVRIHGFANVPRPLAGSSEGLLIFDSVAGEELGDRIRQTQGWREFTLYRAVPKTGDLRLTFSLTGLGEASLDDISISLIDPEPIRQR